MDDEPELAEAARSGSMAAAALGLSFRVPADVDKLAVTASWGRYAPTKSEVHTTEQGRPRSVWKRSPAGGAVEIDLTEGEHEPIPVDPDHERILLRMLVRERDGCRIVDLALVNGQVQPPTGIDTARLYQARLQVTAMDGAQSVFVGHNDPELGQPPSTSDDELTHLALLFRNRRQYAHGRQCAVDADVRDGQRRAWRLTTTSFPAADVPLTVTGDSASMPGLVLDMATLGGQELARNELVRALRPLGRDYRSWLDRQRERLTEPEIAAYGHAGEHALTRAAALADRLDRAIDLLRDDDLAREAFRFANQAMAQPRRSRRVG